METSYRSADGFIFSPQEYGRAAANPPLWYGELARDYFKYMFVFIGTDLNEPLFYHQIERFRAATNSLEHKGLVITPSATEIEKISLQELNLEHIAATLKDFVQWLERSFPTSPSPLDIAVISQPELGIMLAQVKKEDRVRYASIFDHVVLVDRTSLDSDKNTFISGKIRDFYRGFKPTWRDILDGVPAEIAATHECLNAVDNDLKLRRNLLVITGPAGSGKSTLIKQVALRISEKKQTPVYYIEEPVDNLDEILFALEKANRDRYCVFIERLDPIADDLQKTLKTGSIQKGLVVGAESLNIWGNRVAPKLGEFAGRVITLSQISSADAPAILVQIEKFGPWTRLEKLTPEQRIAELVDRARRQLLIGLLETTLGEGFEQLIEKDYERLEDREQRLCLIIIGLATHHRALLHNSYLIRALQYVGIDKSPIALAQHMRGIIHYTNERFLVRHPVYVRHLFERVIDSRDAAEGVRALLSAYTVYEAPIRRFIKGNEALIFRGCINHRFLKTILHDSRELIIGTYEMFEKSFEKDGLFWLQYGLALRDFGFHDEALSKLRTAFEAYPMEHTEHALAQQELILGTRAPSKAIAYDYLSKAKDRLDRLGLTMASDDIYPIVTLAEGHTQIILKFDGVNDAQMVARKYIDMLKARLRKHSSDQRLKQAHDKLFSFAATGEWKTEENQLSFFT